MGPTSPRLPPAAAPSLPPLLATRKQSLDTALPLDRRDMGAAPGVGRLLSGSCDWAQPLAAWADAGAPPTPGVFSLPPAEHTGACMSGTSMQLLPKLKAAKLEGPPACFLGGSRTHGSMALALPTFADPPDLEGGGLHARRGSGHGRSQRRAALAYLHSRRQAGGLSHPRPALHSNLFQTQVNNQPPYLFAARSCSLRRLSLAAAYHLIDLHARARRA
jgi:hypothetical protein